MGELDLVSTGTVGTEAQTGLTKNDQTEDIAKVSSDWEIQSQGISERTKKEDFLD